ncbi:MAG: alpha/beta hydrolase [Thiolinea sp.]
MIRAVPTAMAAGIEYAEAGQCAQGEIPVICLHGIGGSYASFMPQLEQLSSIKRVIAWNMPGYGRSPLLAETSFTGLAESLLQFMDALSIDQAHLLGHSIGGMLAQELAFRHPERVASLALLGTTAAFGGRDDRFKQQFLRARLQPLDEGLTMPELAAQFVPQITGSHADKAVLEGATATMSEMPEASYRAILACLVTFNRYQDTPRLTMPACLIAGAEDNNAPVATMQKMAAKMSQAEFHVLDGVGHLINLEAPLECGRILQTFYSAQS